MSFTEHLIFFPVLLPMLAGILLLLPGFHAHITRQRLLGLAVNIGLILSAIALLQQSLQQSQMYMMGNWQAPFGIALVNDKLTAVMLLLSAILGTATHMYASGGDDKRGPFFHPLFMFQLMGINGAFLTADIFNLFVFFEILLIASYSLLIHGGGKQRTQAAVHYVLLNLTGSAFFLIGLAVIYAAFGTLNLADMAYKAATLDESNRQLAQAGGLLLLVVFGLKAALLPLHFWLPRTYAYTSAPVAALFAIMTKVGIYSIWRVHTAVFGDYAGPLANIADGWLWPLGWLTLVAGIIAVLASNTLKLLVANLVVVSAGTLLLMLAQNEIAATAAALYYLLHSTLMAAALFLLAGMITAQRGQAQDRFVKSRPLVQHGLLGSLFVIAAVAMIGLPPLSGFVGKILLLQASVENAGWVWVPVLLSGLAAMVILTRAGTSIFWRVQGVAHVADKASPLQVLAVVLLLAMSPLMVVFGGPLTELTMAAAEQLHQAPVAIAEVRP
ncbi:monovalent cation/H+ antiporter subunit D [Thalassolituus sp. LLYu03]|uniref:monovalent cation/H+ antiporter subunit D n=1 Tax=Thalassolituus sp. LLYu03 TaxID=3421656 RepID=UPI003D28FC17